MSGSLRKRKSLWDSKEEILPPAQFGKKDVGDDKERDSIVHAKNDPKWSDLKTDNELMSKGCSGSWRPSQGNSGQKDDVRDLNDISQSRRAWDGDKNSRVSLGFDGRGQQSDCRSPESNWSQSRRFRRSRSRSRSRSRNRARSRSRSRGRGRDKDMDQDRVRGRSRDRDLVRGRARSRSRSHSPSVDYRRESYGWSERRSGSKASAQPCRDFAAGDCRRGGQCRFLHQKNLDHGDVGRLEKNQAEGWRSRQACGENRYDGEKDETSKNGNKSTMLCNDFQKGRCHRGSSCRYSHHDAFDDNSERSNRNLSFENDCKRQPYKNSNAPCMFFKMGKCQKENCRFSHDVHLLDNLEGKSEDDKRDHDMNDMTNSCSDPIWDKATAVSNNLESTGWRLWGNVRKGTFTNPTTAEKQTGDRRGYSLDDESKQFSDPKWSNAMGVAQSVRSSGPVNSNAENMKSNGMTEAKRCADGRWDNVLDDESRILGGSTWKTGDAENMGIPGSMAVGNSFDRKEPTYTPSEQQLRQEASGQQPATTVMHAMFPGNLQIQQHHNELGDSNAIADYTNSVNRVDNYGNASHSALMPEHDFNKNADSFGSQPERFGGFSQSQQMVSVNPTNGHSIILNEPVQQNFSPANLQNHIQIQHEASVNPTVNSVLPQNTVNSEKVAQISNFMQMFGNGQLPQLYATLNPPNSAKSVPSLPDSANVLPPSIGMDGQQDPATVPQKLYDPIGDSIEPRKCNQPAGVLLDLVEHKNQMLLGHSSAAVGLDSGEFITNGGPDDNNQRSLELRQQKPDASSVLEEDGKSTAEKGKPDKQNISVGNMDADAKNGDGSNGKDEKAMRLFKIALVEFVKDILKPKWKEGQMSREVHKEIVKKVVDKVTSTIQGANIPKTQERIDHYLSFSKLKLIKLVEAYTQKCLKPA